MGDSPLMEQGCMVNTGTRSLYVNVRLFLGSNSVFMEAFADISTFI